MFPNQSDVAPLSGAISSIIPLRGHHLLCLLTYKGLGYSPAFVERMTAVALAIGVGASVRMVVGPDLICRAPCPRLGLAAGGAPEGLCDEAARARDDAQILTTIHRLYPAWGGLLRSGRVIPDLGRFVGLGRRLLRTQAHLIRASCADCAWDETCRAIIAQDFEGVLLQPRRRCDVVPCGRAAESKRDQAVPG